MLALPARIAGCREVILCTPCGRDGRIAPEILYAADLCGVDRVFALGGAQAVAAMAYGTESIPRVDKIFGPGNRYVTKAKQLAGAADVAVDLPAGPSEVLVLADEDARPEFAAADLLSQAEHGDDSQAVLVCRSEEFARRAIASVGEQAARLSRDAIGNSLANSRIVVFSDPDEQIAFADAYAPEHLIVAMRDAWDAAARITAAGSVFIGGYSPESAGDYASGTNHTLPTGGWARAYSGVNTESFMRKITYQELTRGGLEALAPTITAMAEAEGAGRTRQRRAHPDGRRCAMKPLAQLVRPNILALQPYSTARDEYAGGGIGVWLDANESPYDNGVNRYPDPHQRELKAQLAALKGVRSGQIFLGNGSDEAIDLAFRIFCEPGRDNAVSIAPTYGMYRVAAQTNDVELREVPLGADFSLPVEALLAAADGRTKLLWLCSPNNPTGNAFPDREIEELLRRFDGVVVLDEAYIDFAEGRGFLPRLDEFPNLIVLQTLSKAWGMAGLRLGLAFASERIAALFGQVKYPYNINTLTQQTAAECLHRNIAAQVAQIREERGRLAAALAGCGCIERVYPSQANFLLVKTADPDRLYGELIAAGVIVRNRTRIAGCEGCLRITVGTPAENGRMLETVKNFRP